MWRGNERALTRHMVKQSCQVRGSAFRGGRLHAPSPIAPSCHPQSFPPVGQAHSIAESLHGIWQAKQREFTENFFKVSVDEHPAGGTLPVHSPSQENKIE